MTTSKNQDHGHHNKSAKSDHDAKGKNLSLMSKDQVKKTAAQGGKAAHSAAPAAKSTASHGKQGFASMPKAQVKEIAAKGGKAGHSDKSHK